MRSCPRLASNLYENILQDELMLFKADIDAAYRRIPLLPCMHWVARVH